MARDQILLYDYAEYQGITGMSQTSWEFDSTSSKENYLAFYDFDVCKNLEISHHRFLINFIDIIGGTSQTSFGVVRILISNVTQSHPHLCPREC